MQAYLLATTPVPRMSFSRTNMDLISKDCACLIASVSDKRDTYVVVFVDNRKQCHEEEFEEIQEEMRASPRIT